MKQPTIPFRELEKKAQHIMREALASYGISEEMKKELDVAKGHSGNDCVFTLYIAGEPRDEGRIIASVRLDAITGETKAVKIYLDDDPRGVRAKDLPADA